MGWIQRAAALAGGLRAWGARRAQELERLIGSVERRWALLPRRWRALLYPLCVAMLWWLAAGQAAYALSRPLASPSMSEIVLLTGLHTMPLLLCWRRPLVALAPILLAAGVTTGTWPLWPLGDIVALAIALYAVGVSYSRPVAIAAGVVAVASVLPSTANQSMGMAPLVSPLVAGLAGVMLVTADNVRNRRRAEDALAQQQVQYQQEQARRAVLEERSRIARELHDVVAHHMSMIAVQAETAPYRISGLPDASVRDYAAIGATARGALTEMRRLLGVLRSEADHAATTPQPGLHQLGELVAGARAAGMPVRLSVRGTPAQVPAAVDLSAFRIVQEALSNAGSHAPGASVEVEVCYAPDRLEVTVVDDGRPGAAPPRAPEPGGPPAARHGLLGMSERVAMLSGQLHAAPRPEGGFRVHASLPLDSQLNPHEARPPKQDPDDEDGRQ